MEEKKKKQPILDELEDKISLELHYLSVLQSAIKDKERSSSCAELHRSLNYILYTNEKLEQENRMLRRSIREKNYLIDELLKERTPDGYMDAVATALAMFPIASVGIVEEASGIRRDTIKKAAARLGLVFSDEERQEARQRMKECGCEDIEKRGGKNKKEVEMLVNGKVVATFGSVKDVCMATGKAGTTINDWIKSGKVVNGVGFRYKGE